MNFLHYFILFGYLSLLFLFVKKRSFKSHERLKKMALFLVLIALSLLGILLLFVILWNSGESYREEQHIALRASYHCIVVDADNKNPITDFNIKSLTNPLNTLESYDDSGYTNLLDFRDEKIIVEAINYVADTIHVDKYVSIDTLYLKHR